MDVLRRSWLDYLGRIARCGRASLCKADVQRLRERRERLDGKYILVSWQVDLKGDLIIHNQAGDSIRISFLSVLSWLHSEVVSRYGCKLLS